METRGAQIADSAACVLISPSNASAKPEILRGFAEACFRFSPQIALGEEAVFIEIGKCRNLMTEESLKRRLQAMGKWFECRVQVGFGATAPAALAAARFPVAHLPLEALFDFACPFVRDEDRLKAVRDLVAKLRMLGFKTTDDFARFPVSGIGSRFGEIAAELSAVIRGELPVAWPEFKPAERIVEAADVEDDVSVQSLIFILRGLTDRVFSRLWGRCERASVIGVKFELAKWSSLKPHEQVREWRIELPLPQGSTAGVIPIVQERLMADLGRVALGAPVTKVSFEVLESVPGNGAQKDFFNPREQEKEAWNALVGRLSYKLGNGRVFVALPVERYLPEKAWRRGLEFMRAADSSFPPEWPERPARLLRNPEPIEKEGDTLVHRRTGKEWRVLKWEGPERLSGEWWLDPEFEGYHRDYFRVIAKGGEELWVFYSRNKTGLFLHGYFD